MWAAQAANRLHSQEGGLSGSAYAEYDVRRPRSGWVELDSLEVWNKVRETIQKTVGSTGADPVQAISASSFGEATVPIGRNRTILGHSILHLCSRGEEYVSRLQEAISPEELYLINGNIMGNAYSLTKLLWTRDDPRTWEQATCFLHRSGCVLPCSGRTCRRLLTGKPDAPFRPSESGRSLPNCLRRGNDPSKLPRTVPSATAIGIVSDSVAEELGLPSGDENRFGCSRPVCKCGRMRCHK